MAQTTYRANLTAAEFPFLSEFQGRSIIIPGVDQNYSRQLSSTKNKDRDVGIPQVYYMHDVIPTDSGLSSIAYQEMIGVPLGSDSTFTEIFHLRDPNENFAYFARTTSGRNYICTDLTVGWALTTAVSPAVGRFVTTAHVNGQTYIYFGGVGCYKYNFTTKVLDAVVLVGLDAAQVLGICASSGYMIAWTKNSIMWSSLISPTDFTPSLITGAGGSGVQQTKAEITCCLPQNGGFIIYTKKNAIADSYSGNAQYPFTATEIIGAGGLSDPSLAAYDGNSTNHYVYGSSGMQEVGMSNAVISFPQVTDFISGAQFEDFDPLTATFTISPVIGAMKKKLVMISNRYLVLSYGLKKLTHALVYDMALARWGKFRTEHVDCFEYSYPSPDTADAPRRSIGFLKTDGSVSVVVMSYDTTGSNGCIVLGKYQMERARYIKMQELHLESVKAGQDMRVQLLSTIDGQNPVRNTEPVLAADLGTYRKYLCNASGLNHSFVLSGAFHVHSLELKFSDAGAVR